MMTANREQLKVIKGLTDFNEEIVTTSDKLTADKLAQVAISLFNEQARQAFHGQDFLFHSLSSFVLKEDPKTGGMSQWRFGELIHTGGGAGIGYLSTSKDDIRSLCLLVDADSIGNPPLEEASFDPFYEKVSLPIESIKEVRPVS